MIACPDLPELAGLTPATRGLVVRTVLAVLPVNPDDSTAETEQQRLAALLAVAALAPRDPLEAILAARAVAAHHVAMACLGRSTQADVSDKIAVRLRNSAVSLSHMFDTALRLLERRQATRPAQAVPVRPETSATVTMLPPRPADPAPESPVAAAGAASADAEALTAEVAGAEGPTAPPATARKPVAAADPVARGAVVAPLRPDDEPYARALRDLQSRTETAIAALALAAKTGPAAGSPAAPG